MKKVTLITTGQPSTNPRLVKEAETLVKLGYEVKVIYCFFQAWAEAYDQQIISRNPHVYVMCGGHPIHSKWIYLKTRVRQKVCALLFRYFNSSMLAARAISRTFTESAAVASTERSDLYIAHNLGALPAAVSAARRNKAKVGYDAEDMHSGQFESANDQGFRLNKYIEEKYFPLVTYFTAASPLIASNYKKLYGYLSPVVINNVFPKISRQPPPVLHKSQPLRLFWFSQTVGPDRGLEQIIEAIGISKINVRFELWGQCSAQYRAALYAIAGTYGVNADQLIIHNPVSPDSIFEKAGDFDIGLAAETGHSLNREICLTNKIFTYIQCGLAVLASDTEAQSLFLKENPSVGYLYKRNNSRDLAERLITFNTNRTLLSEIKRHNYILGQTTLNWEVESQRFIALIQKPAV